MKVSTSSEVVFTEHSLMLDALNRTVKPGTPVRLNDLVTALRNSKRYGAYFSKVNRYGLSRTLSRWLRTGAFQNYILVSGVGICIDDKPERKAMTLEFNVPKATVAQTRCCW